MPDSTPAMPDSTPAMPISTPVMPDRTPAAQIAKARMMQSEWETGRPASERSAKAHRLAAGAAAAVLATALTHPLLL
eukprot:324810-Pyramimonas_sp.AAC.1